MQSRLVLDTSGFIHGEEEIFHRALIGQREDGSDLYIYTSPLVVREVRDALARKRLQQLESVLIVLEPNSSCVKAGKEHCTSLGGNQSCLVMEFARRTGDYPHLSRTDIQVLSLTLMLELETNNGKFLKPELLELLPSEARRENNQDDNQPKTTNEDSVCVEQVESALADVQITDATTNSSFDVWIHNENIDSIVQNSKARKKEALVQERRVGCMTSDFSMQNLLLQMGLVLISPDGRRVKKLKSFVLRCESCFHITKQVDKLFCPHCGNHTLLRTTCKTDKQGNLLVFPPKRKKNNLRGTIFPIPKPQSGRNANNLILCEDEYMEKQRKLKYTLKKKAYRDVLDPATEYNASPFFQKEQPLIIGYNTKCVDKLRRSRRNKK